jgi:hypothetical protein
MGKSKKRCLRILCPIKTGEKSCPRRGLQIIQEYVVPFKHCVGRTPGPDSAWVSSPAVTDLGQTAAHRPRYFAAILS